MSPTAPSNAAVPGLLAAREDEFAAGASAWPGELSRRRFLQLAGASLALAGLDGCKRRLAPGILPRAAPPAESAAPGRTLAFASAASFAGYARGILATSRDGRPTKIEGNPDHPESLGATDVFTQAAILSLYDPDRSSTPLRIGLPATWAAFDAEWLERRASLAERRGAGLAVLAEPTTSPTFLREMGRVLETLPRARWFQHDPLATVAPAGEATELDLEAAEVIVALQSDFLYRHPAALRHGRALAGRRRVENGRVRPPRFYAIEATPSVTGALADFRLPASPARLRVLLDALARLLEDDVPSAPAGLADEERLFLKRLASDVRANPGRVACSAGDECDPDLRRWAAALNARHGARATRRVAVPRSDRDPRAAGGLGALAAAIRRGEVSELFILGANPVYTAPADLRFAEALRRVGFSVHSGEHADETAAETRWHLPAPHFLETWSDLRAFGGVATVQQPLIEPLHASRSALELLRGISAPPGAGAHELVRETWRERWGAEGADFDTRWHRALESGIAAEAPTPAPVANGSAAPEFPRLAGASGAASGGGALTAIFLPDPNLFDGRWANNGWLQELPRPFTCIVWGNALLLSPRLAAEQGLVNGDLVRCEVGERGLEAPVWIMPGQADDVVALFLGQGRARAGSVGDGVGYDAYLLRSSRAPWHETGVRLRKLGRSDLPVSTQEHFTMAGRDLARVVTPAEAARAVAGEAPDASLYPAWPRDGHAWGMSIDLSTCLGCNACVIACQAENNIPVVGREQVALGREMHWLRVDRYFSGDPANPRFLHQPVPCMHCEKAPCEVICPVGATVHSSEGLNDMVYNRCVGTRYCSNNCPYKVRRFNFLDYRAPEGSRLNLQANPEVTVRERGVMEKCTYCVQRINAARIAAERERRPIRDGEARTACQQVCPAEAIVFGDLADAGSRVSRRKAEPTDYALLAELNTRPRTTYLAMVRHAPDA